MRTRQLFFAVALSTLLPAMADAQIIDQQATLMGLFGFAGNNLYGQSFVAGASNISGAGVFARASPDDEYDRRTPWFGATFELWSAVPTTRGAQRLAFGSGRIDGVPVPPDQLQGSTASGIVQAFWEPVPIDIGQSYFLTVKTGGFSNRVQLGSSTDYASGNYYFFDGSEWLQFGTGDLAFQTYTTPEPSTYLLLAVGLSVVGVARRRRQTPS